MSEEQVRKLASLSSKWSPALSSSGFSASGSAVHSKELVLSEGRLLKNTGERLSQIADYSPALKWTKRRLPNQTEFAKPSHMGHLAFIKEDEKRNVFVSFDGLVAVSLSDNPETVVANQSFSSGIHVWEILCPYDTLDLKVGVIGNYKTNESFEFVQSFKCTMARTITVELNLNEHRLLFWLNGSPQHDKAINLSPAEYTPCLVMTSKQTVFMLNPFCERPKTHSTQTYGLNIGISMLASLVFTGHALLVVKSPKMGAEGFNDKVSSLTKMVPIESFLESEDPMAVLLRLTHPKDVHLLAKAAEENGLVTSSGARLNLFFLAALDNSQPPTDKNKDIIFHAAQALYKAQKLKEEPLNDIITLWTSNLGKSGVQEESAGTQNGSFLDERTLVLTQEEESRLLLVPSFLRPGSGADYAAQVLSFDQVEVSVNKKEWEKLLKKLDMSALNGLLGAYKPLQLLLKSVFVAVAQGSVEIGQRLKFKTHFHRFYSLVQLLIASENISLEKHREAMRAIEKRVTRELEGLKIETKETKKPISTEEDTALLFNELPSLFEEDNIGEAPSAPEPVLKEIVEVNQALEEEKVPNESEPRPDVDEASKWKLSIAEHENIIRVLLKVEEALFAATISTVPSRDVWLSALTTYASRLHTSFGRLVTFGSTQQSRYSPLELAEHGLFLRNNLTGDICHYQCPHWPVDIFFSEEESKDQLAKMIRAQLPLIPDVYSHFSDRIETCTFTLSFKGIHIPKNSLVTINAEEKLLCVLRPSGEASLWGLTLVPVHLITFNYRAENMQGSIFIPDAYKEAVDFESENKIELLNETIGCVYSKNYTPEVSAALQDLEEMGLPIEHTLSVMEKAGLQSPNDILNHVANALQATKRQEMQGNKGMGTSSQPALSRSSMLKPQWVCQTCSWINNTAIESITTNGEEDTPISCEVCGTLTSLSAFYTEEELQNDPAAAVAVEAHLAKLETLVVDVEKDLLLSLTTNGKPIAVAIGRLESAMSEWKPKKGFGPIAPLDSLAIGVVFKEQTSGKMALRVIRLCPSPDFVHRFLSFEDIRKTQRPRFINNAIFENSSRSLQHGIAPLFSELTQTFILNGNEDVFLKDPSLQNIKETFFANGLLTFLSQNESGSLVVTCPIHSERESLLGGEEKHTRIKMGEAISEPLGQILSYAFADNTLFYVSKEGELHSRPLNALKISEKETVRLPSSGKVISISADQGKILVLAESGVLSVTVGSNLENEDVGVIKIEEKSSEEKKASVGSSEEVITPESVNRIMESLHNKKAAALSVENVVGCKLLADDTRDIRVEFDESASEEGRIDLKFGSPLQILQINVTIGWERSLKNESALKASLSNAGFFGTKELQLKTKESLGAGNPPEQVVRKDSYISQSNATHQLTSLMSLVASEIGEKLQGDKPTSSTSTTNTMVLPLSLVQAPSHPTHQFFMGNILDSSEETMGATRYESTDIVFHHIHGLPFVVNSVILKSPLIIRDMMINSKPIASGLVFAASHISHFSFINPDWVELWNKDTIANWFTKKQESGEPWLPWEPVGYFSLSDKQSSTKFDIFNHAPVRYLLLRPTLLRKDASPSAFGSCLSFFGAIGYPMIFSDMLIDPLDHYYSSSIPENMKSFLGNRGLKVTTESLSKKRKEEIFNAKEVFVEMGMLSNHAFRCSSLPLGLVFSGTTQLTISGKKVKDLVSDRVSISITKPDSESEWIMKTISVDILIEKGSVETTTLIQKLLDPTQYKSCLHHQIKKLSDESFEDSERLTAIRLSNELLTKASSLLSCISEDIDIEGFLRANILPIEPGNINHVISFLDRIQRIRGSDFSAQLLAATKKIMSEVFSLKKLSYSGLQLLWKLMKWAGGICEWPEEERKQFLLDRFREIGHHKMQIDPKYVALRNFFPDFSWLSFESDIFGPESLVGVSKLAEVLISENEEPPMLVKCYHASSDLRFELVIDVEAVSKISKVQLFFKNLPLLATFVIKVWQYSCSPYGTKTLLASKLLDSVELHQLTQLAFSPSSGCEDQNSIVLYMPPGTVSRYLSIEIQSTVVPGLRVSSVCYPDKSNIIVLPHVYGEKLSSITGEDSEISLHAKALDPTQDIPPNAMKSSVRYGRSQTFTMVTKQNGISLIRLEKVTSHLPQQKPSKIASASSPGLGSKSEGENDQEQELKIKKTLKEKQDSLEQIITSQQKEADLKKVESICEEIQEIQIQLLANKKFSNESPDYKSSLDVILTFSRLVIQDLCKCKFAHSENHVEISKLLIRAFLLHDSGSVKSDALILYSKLKPQNDLAKFILFDLLSNPKERFSLSRIISILSITQGSLSTLINSMADFTNTADTLKTRKQKRILVNQISYNALLADKLLETNNKLTIGGGQILQLCKTLNWAMKPGNLGTDDKIALGYILMDVLSNVLKDVKCSKVPPETENFAESIKQVIVLIDPVLELKHDRIWEMLTKVLFSFVKKPKDSEEAGVHYEKYLSMIVFSINNSLESYYPKGSSREAEALLAFLSALLLQITTEPKIKMNVQILQPEIIRAGIEAICGGKFDNNPKVIAKTFSLINTTASKIGCQPDLFVLLFSNLLNSPESLQLTMLDGIVSITICVVAREPKSAERVIDTIFKMLRKSSASQTTLLIVHKLLNILLYGKSNRVTSEVTQAFGIKPVLEVEALYVLVSSLGEFLLDFLNLGGTDGAHASDVYTVQMLEIAVDFMKLIHCSLTKEESAQSLTKLFKTKGEQLIDPMLKLFEWYSINRAVGKNLPKSPAVEGMSIILAKTIEIFEKVALNQVMSSRLMEKIQQNLGIYERHIDEIINERISSSGSGLLALGKGVSLAFEEVSFKLLASSSTINQFSRSPGLRTLFTRLEKCYSLNITKGKDLVEQQKNEEDLFTQLEMSTHIHKEKSLSQGSSVPLNVGEASAIPNEEECGNTLTSVAHPLNNTNITTVDWSVYKKGQKNRLAFWSLNDKYHDQVPLIASFAEPIDIRMLYVGFNNSWTDYTDKILGTPSSVIVEAAEEDNGSLEGFSYLCTLSKIDDEGYTNNSQVVMGNNFVRPKGNSFVSSVVSLRSRPIKFLLFKFTRPVVTFMEGLSLLSSRQFNNLAVALSFVSVNGVKVLSNKINVPRAIAYMRESSSMSILDRVFSSNQEEALTFLASDINFQEFLKNSFGLFSQHLLPKYGQTVNTMLATLAKCDEILGNWITEKLIHDLSLESPIGSFAAQSKLLLSVILESPPKFYLARLSLLNDFLVDKMLDSIEKRSEDEQKLTSNFSQIITVYDRCILRHVSPAFNARKMQLTVPSIVIKLVKAVEARLPKVSDSFVKAVRNLICIWLFSKDTFVFKDGSSLSDAENLLVDYLLEKQSSAHVLLEILAIMVVGSTSAAEKTIKSGLVSDLITQITASNGTDQPFLGFLDISCESKIIADHLRQNEYAMTLYKKVRDTHEKTMNLGDKKPTDFSPLSQGDIEHAVSLITKLTIQNEDLSTAIAQELVTDVSKVVKSRCMSFVYDVIIKFLYSEAHLPVCIHLKDENAQRFVVDGMKLSTKEQAVKPSGNRIKSKMLTPQQTDKLYSELPKFVDEDMLNQINESNWKLAASSCGTGEDVTPALDTNLCEKGPFLILISGLVEGVSQATVGIFCAKPMPKINTVGSSLDKNLGIKGSKSDFIFLYEGQNSFHFPFKQNANMEYMTIQIQGPTTKGISVKDSSNEVIYLSLINHVDSYVDFYSLGPLPEEEDNFAGGDLQVSSTEFWVLSQPQAETYRSPMAAFTSITQSKYHNSWNAYSPFRTSPVLSVPASLTINGLKHSINKSTNWRIKALKAESDLKGSETVESLLSGETKIIDLEVDAHSFSMVASSADNQVEEEPPRAQNLSLFKIFEEKKGIRCIIDACQDSLSNWSNKEKVNRWKTWIDELNSFSELPSFFSHVVRNSKLLELLFKIMTGAPDVNESNLRAEEKKSWRDEEHNAVRFTYSAIADVFRVSNDPALRETPMSATFLSLFLKRLELNMKEEPRKKVDPKSIEEKPELENKEPEKKPAEPAQPPSSAGNNKKIPKKKGVGYGSDNTGDNSKWNVTDYLDSTKLRNEQTISLLKIIDSFFAPEAYQPRKEMADLLIESALLPILEAAFRSGSLLDIGKNIDLYDNYLKLTRTLALKKSLLPCLLDLDPCYVPKQLDSLYKLLGRLRDTASIFLRTVDPNKILSLDAKDEIKIQYKTAKRIIETFEVVQNSIESQKGETKGEELDLETVLGLPLPQKYIILLKDLRFDYMDMKTQGEPSSYKHHYSNLIQNPYTPPVPKMVRLAQEFADLSNALPIDHTNSIFVRVDKERVDVMKAIIMGAAGTPYAHGAFEFDIFFDDAYPNGPPKCNLETTGHGATRFNPNLYADGKVCLSLLGTWRGQASENWDPKLSTILQVLVSIQAIIMSEDVYFNEPGYEGEAGSVEGEKKNEAYSNIVRYSNIKFAMIEAIENPPKGFETVIRRHFYLKKDEILAEVKEWLKPAEIKPVSYTGLVSDHNRQWCDKFKKNKNDYLDMLKSAIGDLEKTLAKLEAPTPGELLENKVKRKSARRPGSISQGKGKIEDLSLADVADDEESNMKFKELDIQDEKVKDRWSRYIGAMGVEAVAKQAKARIFLSGLSAVGVEIAKNIVLAGVAQLTLHDAEKTTMFDLSGQFFLSAGDIGKNRAMASLPRIQQLNYYVKCDALYLKGSLPTDLSALESKEYSALKNYDVLILVGTSKEISLAVSNFCQKNNKKLILVSVNGTVMRIFNDFGKQFTVLDVDGEDPQELLIKNITNEEEAVVKLVDGLRHGLQDGDEVAFTRVEGMVELNSKIEKVKVINAGSFKIGNTLSYSKYTIGGLMKKVKRPLALEFKPYHEQATSENPIFDEQMICADLLKFSIVQGLHVAFDALDMFKTERNQLPKVWSLIDAQDLVEYAKKAFKQYEKQFSDLKEDQIEKIMRKLSFTARGMLPPLAAFAGGFVAQEAIKAITGKFTPIRQFFYLDCSEIIPEVPALEKPEDFAKFVEKSGLLPVGNRYDALRVLIGGDLLGTLAKSSLFMVGAGAIGCELLKNFAMLGIGTAGSPNASDSGKIELTDPDIIEVSNLNRQFLFREKHLRKPKSVTAAAAALQMNPDLKGHLFARLDKVHAGTANIYTDKYFEGMSIVMNALDNIPARRYIDQRCVAARTPLIESGTLGPKGHVQVIIPGKTESYGSMKDPEEGGGEIPHCTLKMFPEETLHCIEWARDKFGKIFTEGPKTLNKIIMAENTPSDPAEIKAIKVATSMMKKKPKTIEDCVNLARVKFEKYYSNDIKQLLYVYPLDAKTKEGQPFWALPKRPPSTLMFDPENKLHADFIAAYACLMANIYGLTLPENPRKEEFKISLARKAAKLVLPAFVPSDEKATCISQSVEKEKKAKEEEVKVEEVLVEGNSEAAGSQDDLATAIKEFVNACGPTQEKKPICFPEEFEKDNDANFHIDLIYSMANLRSENYKLEPMDWINVKLKAGRIVPALATTTACIAGLQTLELIKVMAKIKIEDIKNVFLNLAIPFMSLSEPGPAPSVTLTKDLKVNLWDRWDIKITESDPLEKILKHLEQTYGLIPRDVFLQSQPIYMHAIMSKDEKGRKQVLETPLVDLISIDETDKRVDLTVTFAHPDKPDVILKDTPPVRLLLEKKTKKPES